MERLSIVFFDTEYTAWPGSLERNWGGQGELRELVQLGAVRVDKKFNEIGMLNLFIKPSRNPILSEYFVELTGITQNQIDACGLHFLEAWKVFADFLHREPTVAYSNGSDDRILMENLALHGCATNIISEFNFRDIQPWFRQMTGRLEFIESSDFLTVFGIQTQLQRHDALSDARTIARAVRMLQFSNAPPLPHMVRRFFVPADERLLHWHDLI